MTKREWRLKISETASVTELLVCKPWTAVLVRYGIHDAIGVAKCNPSDPWDPTVGLALAKSRAVKKIAERLAE